MPTRSGLKRATSIASVIAASLWSGSCPAMGGELMGYKGSRLGGSISCVHPNIINDLIERVGEAENYIGVLRIYIQQGYCLEADVPTTLVKPMADHTFRTWDGHEAEIWETVLSLDRGDGTSESLRSYSIVFPREMGQRSTAEEDKTAPASSAASKTRAEPDILLAVAASTTQRQPLAESSRCLSWGAALPFRPIAEKPRDVAEVCLRAEHGEV